MSYNYRITKENVNQVLAVLNQQLEDYGHTLRYEVSVQSPGDGWTRWQVVTNEGRAVSHVGKRAEIYNVLLTMSDMLYRLNK